MGETQKQQKNSLIFKTGKRNFQTKRLS